MKKKKASESNSYYYSFKLLVENNQFACIYHKCNHYILGTKIQKALQELNYIALFQGKRYSRNMHFPIPNFQKPP